MSPNMCFAAVVFQKVQIALKTGREFLELLVLSIFPQNMYFCFIFSTQKIKAIYLTFSICKRAILNLQQIVFANYYIFSKSQTKKKILQFYSLIGLMKYEAFDILYKYTFLRKRYLN